MGEIALDGGPREGLGVVHQGIDGFHHFDEGGEEGIVVGAFADLFEQLEVGAVVALRHVIASEAGGAHTIEGGVGGGGDFAEDAGELAGHLGGMVVGGHALQDLVDFDEAAQTVDAGVQTIAQGEKLAVRRLGDFGRDAALGDFIDALSRHGHRVSDGFEGIVEALDDLAILAAMGVDIGAVGEFALQGGAGQGLRVTHQGVYGFHHFDEGGDEGIVVGAFADFLELVEVGLVIAPGHIVAGEAGGADAVERGVGGGGDFAEDAGVLAGDLGAVIVLGQALEDLVDLYEAGEAVDRGVEGGREAVQLAGELAGDALGDAAFGQRTSAVDEGVEGLEGGPEGGESECGEAGEARQGRQQQAEAGDGGGVSSQDQVEAGAGSSEDEGEQGEKTDLQVRL